MGYGPSTTTSMYVTHACIVSEMQKFHVTHDYMCACQESMTQDVTAQSVACFNDPGCDMQASLIHVYIPLPTETSKVTSTNFDMEYCHNG